MVVMTVVSMVAVTMPLLTDMAPTDALLPNPSLCPSFLSPGSAATPEEVRPAGLNLLHGVEQEDYGER